MSTMGKADINIRPMERKDVDGVLAVVRRISPAESVLTRRKLIAYDPGGPLDLSFLAEVNNEIVGFVLARLAYVGVPVAEVGIIHTLVVDHDYQRQDIGTRLLSTLSRCCQTEGVSQVRAVVDERDVWLRKFFEKMGFHHSELIIYAKTLET